MTKMKENLNFNTVLLTVLLGLSGWTLSTVNRLEATQAALTERVKNLERLAYHVTP